MKFPNVSIKELVIAALSTGLLTTAVMAQSRSYHFDIQDQSLPQALRNYGQISGQEIIFTDEVVYGGKPTSLKGEYTAEAAIDQLLKGTGLFVERAPSGALMIKKQGEQTSSSVEFADRTHQLAQTSTSQAAPEENTSAIKTPSGSKSASSLEAGDITEVIVTAQKREERLQDVPVPVTAISGATLVESNQLRLQDYYSKVPGLNYSPGQWGEPRIAIRGIVTSPYTNPTVGMMVDDVPYGLSINQNGGGGPDIDPGDLARIEVLRGPQGTLYGASSMGGLLKYVTVDPSMDNVSGGVRVGTSSVRDGSDLGYNLRGSINVPLSDTWAVRASGFTRREPGYIDNVLAGDRDTNRIDAAGGRLSALWRTSEDFSLKLSALVQDSTAHGAAVVQPALGDLRQSFLADTGQYERRSQAYSANLASQLGNVDLVSLTGYSVDSFLSSLDLTANFGGTAQELFSVPNSLYTIDQDMRKFSQELRFSAPLGEKLEWLVGAFYTNEKIATHQEILAVDSTLRRAGNFITVGGEDVTYEEYAAFADLTVRINERFDIQIGGRESRIRQVDPAAAGTGIFVSVPTPKTATRSNAFTYLLTPRFKVTPDLMVYARAASGYRAGGPNFSTAIVGSLPPYTPDETRNYEIGVKGSSLNQMLTFDASVYYIDWKNIQLLLTNVFSYYANAGGAKSQGVEVSTELKPLDGLTISTWVSWGTAVLTKGLPTGSSPFGEKSDRLPYSPRLSGNLSVEQRFPVAQNMTGFVGAAARYVGERAANFKAGPGLAQPSMPSYVQLDLQSGVKMQSWSLNAFVNNAADKRGLTGIYTYAPGTFNYIQPRTFGLSLSRIF